MPGIVVKNLRGLNDDSTPHYLDVIITKIICNTNGELSNEWNSHLKRRLFAYTCLPTWVISFEFYNKINLEILKNLREFCQNDVEKTPKASHPVALYRLEGPEDLAQKTGKLLAAGYIQEFRVSLVTESNPDSYGRDKNDGSAPYKIFGKGTLVFKDLRLDADFMKFIDVNKIVATVKHNANYDGGTKKAIQNESAKNTSTGGTNDRGEQK
jgi:hypothetical protein